MPQNSEQATIFGVHYSTESMAEALQAIRHYIESPGDRPAFCCFINAHCLNIAYKNREYADLLNQADRVWADGVGVEIAAKHVGNPVKENVNGTDMLPLLCEEGHSLYLLGGQPAVADAARDNLLKQHPGLKIVGTHHGFFQGHEEEVIAEINAANPDVLLVAFGVPKQEFWIRDHLDKLHCRVCIGVGGLLDFASGRIPRAPLWMRKAKLEWVYRLRQEPIRLFKRYVIGNPLFLWRIYTHNS